MQENDWIHSKMMELEPLLEASGERNLWSIKLTHGDYSSFCVAQSAWYPEESNICLIWDVEETRAIGLPDHQQKAIVLLTVNLEFAASTAMG